MPVGLGQLLIASVTVLAIIGVVFEVGRRLGRGSAEQDSTQSDVNDLEEKMDQKFAELDERLTKAERIRKHENQVVIEWLTQLTEALKEEDYDVEKPDAVSEQLDIEREYDPGADD